MVKPTAVDIRAYNVGFGDCFLVTFDYGEKKKRSVLVDFGSTGKGKNTPATVMKDIAEDVREFVNEHCGGVLHGVVATHRHKDHISGFEGESGEIIESLKPKVVLQPWTEDPLAQRGAKSATAKSGSKMPKNLAAAQNDFYLQSLDHMNSFSASALAAAHDRMGITNAAKIRFIADDNLKNREAVERLARMGKAGTAEYLRAGNRTKLEEQLPGVKIHVLGPPDLTQTDTILKERANDKKEFWQFTQFWSMLAASTGGGAVAGSAPDRLFPKADIVKSRPQNTRWFIDRADRQLGNQLLGIVRILDDVMNNTSIILLFEVGGKKLLFPGDAQIENWAFALSEPKELPGIKKLLADVDLYKVGHHGSRNATPKSLWNAFKNKSETKGKPGRLKSVVSTKEGKHPGVPRPSLVDALKTETDFQSTEDLAGKVLFQPVTIKID